MVRGSIPPAATKIGKMAKIIINADDLGVNSKVNSAISNALREGLITSSTILANSDTWEEIHEIVKNNPNASFGIHLNLTQGDAITQSNILQKYGITDKENRFTNWRDSTIDFTEELLSAIYEEWDAQVNRVINEQNIPVSHIDGHHHIHTLDVLQPCLISLMKKYGIKAVRNKYVKPLSFVFNKKNKPLPYSPCKVKSPTTEKKVATQSIQKKGANIAQRIVNVFKTRLQQIKWTRKIKKNFKTTDYFDSYENIYKDTYNGCALPKNCTIELMCHPGHEKYEFEYSLIASKALQSKMSSIELINYKDL